MMTGPRAIAFRGGWAFEIFANSRKAHYFRRADASFAVPDCMPGRHTPAGKLHDPGSFVRCKICERKQKTIGGDPGHE